MSSLTKRERVLRTANFEETDRVPLYDILQNDSVIYHFSGVYPSPETGVRPVALAVGRTLDMTRMVSAPQSPQVISTENGFRIRVERWTSWIIERPFKDLDELIPWVKDQIVRTHARSFTSDEKNRFLNYVHSLQTIFAEADPTGLNDPTVLVLESGVGLTEMYHDVGIDLFTELLVTEPTLVEEWLEARLLAELRRVEKIADPEFVPIVLTYDDIAHKTGLIFNPDWLRQVWVPRLRQLVNAWHTRDVLCLFHSDGNLWGILHDLVDAGIDGLNPLETLAGMSIKEVRKKFPKLFLAGGIDVSQLLSLGTPEMVRAACDEAIQDTEGRGYFLGSTTELHWEIPLENALAMFHAGWESGQRHPFFTKNESVLETG